jgi:fatty acid desaturase
VTASTTPDGAALLPRLAEGTVLPAPDALPDVLPTDRLNDRGVATRQLRDELRRIPNIGNVWTVAMALGQVVATAAIAVWADHPLVWIIVFVAMGAAHARMAILMHEAAHRLLFSNRRLNDFVGRWVGGYPGFVPFELYRRTHFAHHRDEFGPDEPDIAFYSGYPSGSATFRRRLIRDITGQTGWKNLRALAQALRSPGARPMATRILVAQVLVASGFALAGHPWLYLILWLGPWLTVWKVMNRLRSIAEHGGMQRSDDRRETTHHVRHQAWWARATIVPYKTGWHLAHHVDMGVPFGNLPRLHAELESAGWVNEANTHRTYLDLWRDLVGR